MSKTQSPIFIFLAAGALATIAFDTFGQAITPLLGFANLAPVPLATQTIQVLTGIKSTPLGFLLHIITGMVFYPLGWTLIARPLQQRILPNLHWLITAVIYGIALWVFALYFVAHLISGNPPFLGFIGITWVAFFGHIIFAIVAAWVLEPETT